MILAERPSSRVTIAGHAAHGVGTKGNRRYVFTEPLPSSGSELLLLRKCHGRAHLHSQYSRPILMYIMKCLNIDRHDSDNHPETPTVSQTSGTRRTQLYPNPGHLGRSSHVTIFNEIFPEDIDQDIMNNIPAAIRNRSPASAYPSKLLWTLTRK